MPKSLCETWSGFGGVAVPYISHAPPCNTVTKPQTNSSLLEHKQQCTALLVSAVWNFLSLDAIARGKAKQNIWKTSMYVHTPPADFSPSKCANMSILPGNPFLKKNNLTRQKNFFALPKNHSEWLNQRKAFPHLLGGEGINQKEAPSCNQISH